LAHSVIDGNLLMKSLIIAVGALMALFGVAAVWQGWDIVQIERGWASVISGSMVFAGGVITMALGFLIRAVDALRTSLTAQSFAHSPAVRTIPEVVAFEPESAFVAPPTVVSREDDVDSPAQHLATGVAAAPPVNAPVDQPQPEPLTWAARRKRSGRPVARVTPVDQNFEIGELGAGTALRPVLPDLEMAAPLSAAFAPHLVRSVATEPTLEAAQLHSDVVQTPEEQQQHGLPDDAAEAEPALDWLRAAKGRSAKRPFTEPTPLPDEAPTQTKTAGIVRKYESAGVKYTLHGDGSIDADSPAGLFHFANMNELKEHLARAK
jgi:hypothetical protein